LCENIIQAGNIGSVGWSYCLELHLAKFPKLVYYGSLLGRQPLGRLILVSGEFPSWTCISGGYGVGWAVILILLNFPSSIARQVYWAVIVGSLGHWCYF